MNEIEKLIQELCPDGVEYRRLLSVSDVLYGYPCDASKFNDNQLGSPLARIRDVLDGYTKTYTTEQVPEKYILRKNDLLIGMDGNFHVANWKMDGGILCQRVCKIYSNDNEQSVLNGYLSHLLKPLIKRIEESKPNGTVKHLLDRDLKELEIPLPPITIQEKIVEILDKFTSLEAELEAELEARRKQYEYYREKLLTFSPDDENVRWATLGEIGTFVKGSGIQKSDFVENGYPCIHYGQLHTYYGTFTKHNKSFISKALFDKCKKAQNGDLIIATTSEDVEACCKATAWLGDSEVAVSGDAHIYHHNQNPKYITYFFQTELFSKQKRKYASGVKVVRVSSDNLSKISIPLPPLSEQRRIVEILDRFEALTNDLQAGLPAEIAARRQQYEYYREKLLTFKRKTV